MDIVLLKKGLTDDIHPLSLFYINTTKQSLLHQRQFV